ncbi:MAG: hypothetical protein ACP5I7_06920, partial [Sulfolobales archaeon]
TTVRAGVNLIDELERKIEFIKRNKPELLRKKLIKVIYVDYATPSAIERGKEKGVWILKATGDLTPRIIHEISI